MQAVVAVKGSASRPGMVRPRPGTASMPSTAGATKHQRGDPGARGSTSMAKACTHRQVSFFN
jgi:hypothetical protein